MFLSHDVDWRRQGPPIEHIYQRRDRFEDSAIRNLPTKNPYYNLPEYMELEDKFGVRSTFFFRTIYENGIVEDYEDDIRTLVKGGWEIGLHTDPSSANDIDKVLQEKRKLENITRQSIVGNRVHYLRFDKKLPEILQSLGFAYDSSIRKTKDEINKEEMGYSRFNKILEFPITLMDAYLFTYMNIKEDGIIPIFKSTLEMSRKINNDFNVITVIWHDNVLQMKGGRMFKKIIEYLTSEDDVRLLRGIDLVNIINAKND